MSQKPPDTAAKMRAGRATRTFSRRWCAPARGGSAGEITKRRQTDPILCIMVEFVRAIVLFFPDLAGFPAMVLLRRIRQQCPSIFEVVWWPSLSDVLQLTVYRRGHSFTDANQVFLGNVGSCRSRRPCSS